MLDVLNREVPPAEQERPTAEKTPGAKSRQVVLVFQGGGALGAYQAGVYQALHETHVEPDWIIGTSIGAINASLIAGNEPENRIDRLEEFWRRVQRQEFWRFAGWRGLSDTAAYWSTLLSGIPGFFEPNPWAFVGPHCPLGKNTAGFYSTAPLERTLAELVDFTLVERCTPRLTVGAAQVRTSEMRYFDSRETAITVRHVMASGALPPAFPAVRIQGELYWDGRHSLQHPERDHFRGLSAPQLFDLRGAHVESHGSGTGNDLGSAPPAQGHSILQPRLHSYHPAAAGAPVATRDIGACQIHPGGAPQRSPGAGSGRIRLSYTHACGAAAGSSSGQ
jgi:Patatin-like phospholipase